MRLAAYLFRSALGACAVLLCAATGAQAKPEKYCAADRIRICGTNSKTKCDLKDYPDQVSSACRGEKERKKQRKQRRKQERQ